MDCINRVRTRIWKKRARGELKEALIDIDGTLATTLGERKQGMALSYNGIWGYHPLVICLANTREVLFLVNRPGNGGRSLQKPRPARLQSFPDDYQFLGSIGFQQQQVADAVPPILAETILSTRISLSK